MDKESAGLAFSDYWNQKNIYKKRSERGYVRLIPRLAKPNAAESQDGAEYTESATSHPLEANGEWNQGTSDSFDSRQAPVSTRRGNYLLHPPPYKLGFHSTCRPYCIHSNPSEAPWASIGVTDDDTVEDDCTECNKFRPFEVPTGFATSPS